MAQAENALAGCEHIVASDAVLHLTAQTRLSAYDCEFVVLARSLAVPLVTEDRAVLNAFPEVAIDIEQFLARFPAGAHEKRARYHGARSRKAA